MGLDAGPYVIELYYHADVNLFTDKYGDIVYDIFSYITPNDLYMFKNEPQYTQFECKNDPYTICEILEAGDFIYDYGDGYFDQRKENDDEHQIYFDPHCHISDGRNCRFSSESEDVRREVCAICRGGD